MIPFARWVGQFMAFLQANLTWLTRGLARILDVPLDVAFAVLARNYKIGSGAEAMILPRLSWLGVCAAVAIAGYSFGGARLAALGGGCLLYIALFGQWDSAMLTLALIIIAVPFCVVIGLLIGIWAWRNPRVDAFLVTPALDLMQTMPTFAYLIPMLLLFGNSPVSAMLATGIFATPPMVRATTLALSRVPSELNDFGDMAGCTRRQKLWRILIPSSRPTLMLGVNQVIMLALNMVIIASMIGAGGLGYDVLLALRALKIGQGMEAGIAIVVLAIMLDRLSQAAARQTTPAWRPPGPFWRDHPYVTLALAILAATTLLSLFIPALGKLPRELTISTAPMWKAAVDWVNVNYFDAIEAFRTTLLIYVLNPVRAFFEAIPWLAAVLLLALAGLPAVGPEARPAGRRPHRLLRRNRPLGKDHGDRLSVRRIGVDRRPARHAARAAGLAQRSLRGLHHADHRHPADDPVLLLHHPGGDAVPRRRRHRHDRHRGVRHRAGDPLHQPRHSPGGALADRGRQGIGLHAEARPSGGSSFPWRCPRSCSASIRRSCFL